MLQLVHQNGPTLTNAGIEMAPAVASNAVYVTTALGNATYALNAQTGALIWSFQTGGNTYSSPAVVNGVAYFGSYDGNVYAIGQKASSTTSSSSTGLPLLCILCDYSCVSCGNRCGCYSAQKTTLIPNFLFLFRYYNVNLGFRKLVMLRNIVL